MDQIHFAQLKLKTSRLVLALNVLSVVLAVVSIFSIPFPFYRQNWIREVWGLTGLIHALIFLLLSRQVEKISLPATFGVLGLLLNEQILLLCSFYRLFAYNMLTAPYFFFFVISEALILGFGYFFISNSRDLYFYLKKHVSFVKASNPDIESPEHPWKTLFGSGLTYAILAALIYPTFSLPPAFTYSVLKVTGCLVSLNAFVWAGIEIYDYFCDRQSLLLCRIKVATHGLLLIGFLWVIYRTIPFQSVLVI